MAAPAANPFPPYAVTMDDTVTVVCFSQIVENPPEVTNRLRGICGAQN
jgi:hypothetical protein